MPPEYMPIMRTKIRIPWTLIAPHEQQAFANHGQTLRRLAQRGGLGPSEAVAILLDQPRGKRDEAACITWLQHEIARHDAAMSAAQQPEGAAINEHLEGKP